MMMWFAGAFWDGCSDEYGIDPSAVEQRLLSNRRDDRGARFRSSFRMHPVESTVGSILLRLLSAGSLFAPPVSHIGQCCSGYPARVHAYHVPVRRRAVGTDGRTHPAAAPPRCSSDFRPCNSCRRTASASITGMAQSTPLIPCKRKFTEKKQESGKKHFHFFCKSVKINLSLVMKEGDLWKEDAEYVR